jgi:hypothetical protein
MVVVCAGIALWVERRRWSAQWVERVWLRMPMRHVDIASRYRELVWTLSWTGADLAELVFVEALCAITTRNCATPQ